MAFLLALAPLSSSLGDAPPSARELLERGIRQDTILTDIDAAIATYQDALKHKNLGPATKLEATLRLAEGHEALGHSLSAWMGYQEVAECTSVTNAFPEEALVSKVSLLIDFAEEEAGYNSTNIHFLGDLFLGIEGALTHKEASRALALTEKSQSTLASLLGEAEAFPEHRLLERMQADLSKVADLVRAAKFADALELLKGRVYHRAFSSREALSDEDEVFGYALERLDNVVRALNEGSVIEAQAELQSVTTYLAPLSPWPRPEDVDGTRHGYFKTLEALVSKLESAIVKDQLGDARTLIDDFTAEQAEDGGMVHWHLEEALDLDFANPEVLPHFAAATLHLEAVGDALDQNATMAAKDHMKSAIQVAQTLQTKQTNTSDESGATTFLETLQEMASLLDSGQLNELLQMIGEEQEPES